MQNINWLLLCKLTVFGLSSDASLLAIIQYIMNQKLVLALVIALFIAIFNGKVIDYAACGHLVNFYILHFFNAFSPLVCIDFFYCISMEFALYKPIVYQ